MSKLIYKRMPMAFFAKSRKLRFFSGILCEIGRLRFFSGILCEIGRLHFFCERQVNLSRPLVMKGFVQIGELHREKKPPAV